MPSRLTNVLRRWKSPSPAKNIVVRKTSPNRKSVVSRRRRTSSPNKSPSPNKNVVVRKTSPNKRKLFTKETVVRLLIFMGQVYALWELYKYNKTVSKEEATKMGLQVLNAFEKITKLFGKYSEELIYVTSAILPWVIEKLQTKGKFELHFEEFITRDIYKLAISYAGARAGLYGIPLLKTQLESYKRGSFLGMIFGSNSAALALNTLQYIIAYCIAVLKTLISANVLQGAVDSLKYMGVVTRNGRLRIMNRSRSTRNGNSKKSPNRRST